MAKQMNARLRGAPAPRAAPVKVFAGGTLWGASAMFGLFFAALTYTYFIVVARRLDYAINKGVEEEMRLHAEISSLHVTIAELEDIPALLERKETMELDLVPCRFAPIRWLDPDIEGPCPPVRAFAKSETR